MNCPPRTNKLRLKHMMTPKPTLFLSLNDSMGMCIGKNHSRPIEYVIVLAAVILLPFFVICFARSFVGCMGCQLHAFVCFRRKKLSTSKKPLNFYHFSDVSYSVLLFFFRFFRYSFSWNFIFFVCQVQRKYIDKTE